MKGVMMDFSEALKAVKDGHRIKRSGWNGSEMFVVKQDGYPNGVPINANTANVTGFPVGQVHVFRPYLTMYTAQKDFVPWVASQTDLLAEDWEVLEKI
jgi:hypothetical protein